MIDLTQVGTQKATLKVVSVEPKGDKLELVTFENVAAPIRKWKSKQVSIPLTPGSQAEATIEVKTGNYGNEGFLEAFGAPVAKSNGFAGGGGRAYQPKTPAEIHSASICGLLKSCIEKTDDVDAANRWADWAIGKYKAAVGGMGGAA